MPFKSQAQRRKFAELLLKGEISNKNIRRMEPRDRLGEASGTGESQSQAEIKREKAEVHDKGYTNEGQAPLAGVQSKASLRSPGCRI